MILIIKAHEVFLQAKIQVGILHTERYIDFVKRLERN